jgi:hypothetical protein
MENRYGTKENRMARMIKRGNDLERLIAMEDIIPEEYDNISDYNEALDDKITEMKDDQDEYCMGYRRALEEYNSNLVIEII